VFTGEYRHAVDGKGRIAVPARFRTQLDGGIVVARWLDTCLAIFPMAAWEELATKVGSLPMTDPNARLLQRQLFAGAFETELDRQGRVLVPQGLRTFAGLEGEALVQGSRDHAEIWAPARWQDYSRSLEDPDAFAQAIAGLGI
jgi:MraZ protein